MTHTGECPCPCGSDWLWSALTRLDDEQGHSLHSVALSSYASTTPHKNRTIAYWCYHPFYLYAGYSPRNIVASLSVLTWKIECCHGIGLSTRVVQVEASHRCIRSLPCGNQLEVHIRSQWMAWRQYQRKDSYLPFRTFRIRCSITRIEIVQQYVIVSDALNAVVIESGVLWQSWMVVSFLSTRRQIRILTGTSVVNDIGFSSMTRPLPSRQMWKDFLASSTL
jgi:hypothetical protein